MAYDDVGSCIDDGVCLASLVQIRLQLVLNAPMGTDDDVGVRNVGAQATDALTEAVDTLLRHAILIGQIGKVLQGQLQGSEDVRWVM